jgi:hypothetical protein
MCIRLRCAKQVVVRAAPSRAPDEQPAVVSRQRGDRSSMLPLQSGRNSATFSGRPDLLDTELVAAPERHLQRDVL